jgi:hypothetical protein
MDANNAAGLLAGKVAMGRTGRGWRTGRAKIREVPGGRSMMGQREPELEQQEKVGDGGERGGAESGSLGRLMPLSLTFQTFRSDGRGRRREIVGRW